MGKGAEYLSNWYEKEITIECMKFRSVAQYVVYKLAAIMGDEETADEVLKCHDCTYYGTVVSAFSRYRELWEEGREEIVLNALRQKFLQLKECKEQLIKSNEQEIIEACQLSRNCGCDSKNDGFMVNCLLKIKESILN